nr:AAA family ATPase [Rice orange leaf phytoplasma]
MAGMEEEKQLLQRFIDFLKEPKKYHEAGDKIPKGILFYGPPGTGKTLLAKALAGESDASFYAFSGTDFLQRIHGDGAKKLRDLFEKTKTHKTSIIFIDEIDSFGIARKDSQKEKEITTELLNQMDGIKSKDNENNVIVIAATNRVESLDSALLRPGRFVYVVNVLLPDLKARKAILKLCTKGK